MAQQTTQQIWSKSILSLHKGFARESAGMGFSARDESWITIIYGFDERDQQTGKKKK